ncbi:MAG: hypothetical protein ACYC7E_06475 [Armatimonadota bacterium]
MTTHLANLPFWVAVTLTTELFDFDPTQRAQLGFYLRMNDVALPSMYGPTADEGIM